MNKTVIVIVLIFFTISTAIVYRLCNKKWLEFSKAEIFYKKKQYDNAIAYYLSSIENGIEASSITGQLAKSLRVTKRYQQPFALFYALKEKDSKKNAKAFGTLGNFFFTIENYKEAIKCYRYALKLRPSDNIARYELAISLSRSAEYDRAILEYKHLLGEK